MYTLGKYFIIGVHTHFPLDMRVTLPPYFLQRLV